MDQKDYQKRAINSLHLYYNKCNEKNDSRIAYEEITEETLGVSVKYTPIKGFADIPYICLRMPTGAGKTYMACFAIREATEELLHKESGVVLWLVPSNPIKNQTLKALQDRCHAYRKKLDEFYKEVNVVDILEARTVTRANMDNALTIIVSTMQALRIEDTDGRKIYESAGELLEHFQGIPEYILNSLEKNEGGVFKKSLANALFLRRPIIIVDEAHNARTDLSFEVLARFNPSTIIEFTATPNTTDSPSNILHSTSAAELKAEGMVKVPILIETKENWQEIITMAITRLNSLAKLASIERTKTKEYIRPVMLIQAEPNRAGKSSVTPTIVKDYLINEARINKDEIAIATGEINELNGIDIMSDRCPVKYVITVHALREGWDCPFAYVLCSVAEMRSSTAIEQILGRIMRMPNGIAKTDKILNQSYAYVTSSDFFSVANSLENALIQSGFNKMEAKDYIKKDKFIQQEFNFDDEGHININPLGFSTIIMREKPDLEKVDPLIKEKITYDETNSTFTVYGEFTQKDAEIISDCFLREESKYMVRKLQETINTTQEMEDVQKAPFERKIEFNIPGLSILVGDQIEMFEESFFLNRKWDILDYESKITTLEYSEPSIYGKVGEVDVDNKGQVKSRFITDLQEDLILVSTGKSGWTISDLTIWIDKRISHPDISTMKSIPYINAIIIYLIENRKIDIDQLVNDRYRLKKAIEEKIALNRNNAKEGSYQLTLFGENSPVVVDETIGFDFKSNFYPANSYYDGGYEFSHHYYEHVGELKNQGEEFECAQYIDSLGDIEYWIRNLPRKEGSFWLQTSTDKFYPDFVCKLKDGRYMAVEYKGGDRYNNTDSIEKRNLGEIWEKRSGGKCLFVMPTMKDYAAIKRHIEENPIISI